MTYSIPTHFTSQDAFKGLKKTKNKALQDAYQTIIYCCQEIDALREEVDKYKRLGIYGD